jgi:hypothetical protein
MSNSYYIGSADFIGGLAGVIDIKVPIGDGSVLQLLQQKSENNQLWTLVPAVGADNAFQLQSVATAPGGPEGGQLVIDIKVPVEENSPLQVIQGKNEDNQYWTFLPGSEYYYIQSSMAAPDGTPLVIDIEAPVAFGSQLQALKNKQEVNQEWFLIPAPSNAYSPVANFVPGEIDNAVEVNGWGWYPLASISGTITVPTAGIETSFTTLTDINGGWVAEVEGSFGGAPTTVDVQCRAPMCDTVLTATKTASFG